MGTDTTKRFALLLALMAVLGCPISQRATPISCEQSIECFPGFDCINKSCTACGNVCRENLGEGVSSRGASYCGADNVCIQIPPNSLVAPRTLYIEKLAYTAEIPEIELLSPIYRVLPLPLQTNENVQIEVPIENTVTPTAAFVLHADAETGPWTRLTGTSTFATAIGTANYVHYFVAGRSKN